MTTTQKDPSFQSNAFRFARPQAPIARKLLAVLLALAALAPTTTVAQDPAAAKRLFAVQVVDEETGRGVPLVELTTVSNVTFITDSAGYAAIDDVALLGQKVFFNVTSHGYEFAPDGFGSRGKTLELKPGESATLKIKRKNIAERLYRVTGESIYRDSVMLGKKPPIAQPVLNAQVTGQDSVQTAVFNGKVYHFWGDTNRQSYPLGNFGTTGATSDLPGKGGLPPETGINLTYFTAPDGFTKPMFERDGATLFWLDGLFVVKDAKGKEHLLAAVAALKSMTEILARRLVEFDETSQSFRTLKELPVNGPGRPHGHFVRADTDGKSFIYFVDPVATVRVPATYEAAIDPAQYEMYTCVSQAGPIDETTVLNRRADGSLDWAWRKEGMLVGRDDIWKLTKLGKMKAQESHLRPKNAATGEPVELHAGSLNWNAYRKKWVMIANQFGGKTSILGEVWYLESDELMGPWDHAIQIATHDRYSFYNPIHHPFLDQEGGRYIYFEGTYSGTFSRENNFTPRFDYNQMMYRLDLADNRLHPAK